MNRFSANHTKTQKDEGKEKWATFTYVGPETRSITNLFRHTNLKIAYRTTNTIKHHLSIEMSLETYTTRVAYISYNVVNVTLTFFRSTVFGKIAAARLSRGF
jgi:hypothetical protein